MHRARDSSICMCESMLCPVFLPFWGRGVGEVRRSALSLILDSIVGRGNHSRDHVQKIKPRVEQVCRELGLQYQSEENEGRILVNLQGGPAHQAPHHGGGNQHHGGQQHHGGHHQPQQNNNDVAEELVKKGLSRLFKSCCIVM